MRRARGPARGSARGGLCAKANTVAQQLRLPRHGLGAGSAAPLPVEVNMAHRDPHRQGSETHQRRHACQVNENSDAGMKDKSQSRPGTHQVERKIDDLARAPESGKKPRVMPDRNA
jgi:hypothetical protein